MYQWNDDEVNGALEATGSSYRLPSQTQVQAQPAATAQPVVSKPEGQDMSAPQPVELNPQEEEKKSGKMDVMGLFTKIFGF